MKLSSILTPKRIMEIKMLYIIKFEMRDFLINEPAKEIFIEIK